MTATTLFDQLVFEFDAALQTIFPPDKRVCQRATPATGLTEATLSMAERKHIAGLMRVNHAGEVCAQALYQGQALTANLQDVKNQMQQAALEETDHLGWCEQRLHELGGQTSMINAVWYLGSFLIGALAGLAGDKISLGFVAETEKQVGAHLENHLKQLPSQDVKTKRILEQMLIDETEHAQQAKQAGGQKLPSFVRQLMYLSSKLMTHSSYYI